MSELWVRQRRIPLNEPVLMGVVNVNADSFSDPGPRTTEGSISTALSMIDQGASIVDIGAQSSVTRRAPISAESESEAIVPVIQEIVRARPDAVISVDTFKIEVAEAALSAGAHIINDVSGLPGPDIARACAAHRAGLVIMHTAAPPLVRRQESNLYTNVAREVTEFLSDRMQCALDNGVNENSIILDPGPDFTKTPPQTIQLLRRMRDIVALGRPILLALSRKDFVGALTARRPDERGAGTLGAIAALRHVPQQILRVHDVAAAADMLAVLDALTGVTAVPDDLRLPERLRHQLTGT